MNYPQVDIIVLNYNGKKFLDDCFQSVFKSTYPNFKVYLLDNASTEDDVAYVSEKYPQVGIIKNPLNNGYCAAYNLAFSVCKGKYYLCLNNDVRVHPGWLEPLVELAEKDNTIGALQPKLVSFFNEQEFEYAGASGGKMDVYGYPFLRGRVFDTIEPDNGQYNDITDVFWTSGAAMFLRADVLPHSGPLDNSFVHHMDEIDLCWRILMAGYELKVVPASVVAHYGGATIQAQSFKKMYWNHRNSLFMVIKNYGPQQVLSKTFTHIFLDWLAAGVSLAKLQFTRVRAVMAAHVWILLNLGLILRHRKEAQQRRRVSDEVVMKQMYPKSIALAYFLRKKTTYTDLINDLKK